MVRSFIRQIINKRFNLAFKLLKQSLAIQLKAEESFTPQR